MQEATKGTDRKRLLVRLPDAIKMIDVGSNLSTNPVSLQISGHCDTQHTTIMQHDKASTRHTSFIDATSFDAEASATGKTIRDERT